MTLPARVKRIEMRHLEQTSVNFTGLMRLAAKFWRLVAPKRTYALTFIPIWPRGTQKFPRANPRAPLLGRCRLSPSCMPRSLHLPSRNPAGLEADLLGMKPNPKPAAPVPPPASPVTKRSGTKLDLTPEQAKREAAKLREFRNDLEDRKTPAETDARSSPLGRTDE